MSATLKIGTLAGGKRFTLPLDLVTQTAALVGIRGSGKTVTASVVVEEALKAGVPVVVIDPTDVWWGLKSSADGKAAGYPVVIFGGDHGDLPLSAESGRAIADFVVEQNVPVILSLRHLRKGALRKFTMEFAEQLYHRKGEPGRRTPLLVAIDEASQVVPQKVVGETARLVGAIQDLVRLGRSSGFGVVLIDQRPASVNKDVLTQLEVLVAHRISSPQDRKALDEWIQQHDTAGHRTAFLEQLSSLPRGDAWFWSPALDLFELVHVRMRETFDSSRTPKLGEVLAAPKGWATVDLDAVRAHLEEAVAEAASNDPKALKRRIAELEAELRRGLPAAEPDPEAIARATEAATESLRQENIELRNRLWKARDLARQVVAFIELDDVPRAPSPTAPSASTTEKPAPRPATPPAPTRPRARSSTTPSSGPSELAGPQRRIVEAIARLAAVGVEPADRGVIAALAGYTASGGGFRNYLGALRSARLIEYPAANQVALTEDGWQAAGDVDAPATLDELHAGWMSVLDPPHQKILRVLIDAYPNAISREELAAATGYEVTGGGFRNYLGRLRTMGAIDYPRSGQVAATHLLFPEGLHA